MTRTSTIKRLLLKTFAQTHQGRYEDIRPILNISNHSLKQGLFYQSTRASSSLATEKELEKIIQFSDLSSNEWKQTGIVFHQHLLPTLPPLLKTLLKKGVAPQHILGSSKSYSECPAVRREIEAQQIEVLPNPTQTIHGGYHIVANKIATKIWDRGLEKFGRKVKQIIAIDDGFWITPYVPLESLRCPVVAIEQTSSGTSSLESNAIPINTISFANTAIKTLLETPVIVDEMMYAIHHHLKLPLRKNSICGVAGYGPIGRGLAIALAKKGCKVIVYDRNLTKTAHANKDGVLVPIKLDSLINSVDFLFGCSGSDITESQDGFEDTLKNVQMISFGSSDKEFRTLLLKAQEQHNQRNEHKTYVKNKKLFQPFMTVTYRNRMNSRLEILNGGFVANFTRQNEIAHRQRIKITRCSMTGCVVQAMLFFRHPELMEYPQRYMMHPLLQSKIGCDWIREQSPLHDDLLTSFKSIPFITTHSHWENPTGLIHFANLESPYGISYSRSPTPAALSPNKITP